MNPEFDDEVTVAHRPARRSSNARAGFDDDLTRPAQSSDLAAAAGPLDDLLHPPAAPATPVSEAAKTQVRVVPVMPVAPPAQRAVSPPSRPPQASTAWQPPSSALAPNTRANDQVERHRRRQFALLLAVVFVVLVAAAGALAVAYAVQQTGPTVTPAETPAP